MPVTGSPLAALARRYAQPVLLLTETDAPSGASLLSDREETAMMRVRAARKQWKRGLVLLCICGALLLIRRAAMIWA